MIIDSLDVFDRLAPDSLLRGPRQLFVSGVVFLLELIHRAPHLHHGAAEQSRGEQQIKHQADRNRTFSSTIMSPFPLI